LGRYGFSGWIGPEPHGRLPLNSGSSAANTIVNGRDMGFASQAKDLIEQLGRKRDNQPWLIVASFVNPHDITLYGLAAQLSGMFDFHLQEDIVPVNLLEPMPAGPTHRETLA